MSLRDLGWVFLAGGAGASLRVALVPLLDRRIAAVLPSAGTLIVNVLGCFLIGLLSVGLQGAWRPIVLGGFLGGFTTYSAFALLTWDLMTSSRTSAFLAQVALHLAGGLAAVAFGLWVGRLAFPSAPLD